MSFWGFIIHNSRDGIDWKFMQVSANLKPKLAAYEF